MKSPWTQPSLSRDFALLSAAILFILCITSLGVTYSTYASHARHVAASLEKESLRIERTLATEMESASYILSALGKQIVLDQDRSLIRLAQILKSFDNRDYVYSILSWISPEQLLVVSSNKGVLDKPVDISDRDYVKKAFSDPWKMTVGRPIEGRVSGRWIIPVSMGVTDYTGKFIGAIMISIDIDALTDRLSRLIRREGLSFAIVSRTLIPITQVSDDKDFVNRHFPLEKLVNVNFSRDPSALISRGSAFIGASSYAYYRMASDYPYIVLLSYDPRFSDQTVRGLIWSRLLLLAGMGVFFVLFLWIVRVRMIRPILELTAVAAGVARGEVCAASPRGGPVEIEGLAAQIRKVSEYIEENRRIQNELRNKMYLLRKAREQAEVQRRSQLEFMAYASQEMRNPLNNIIGGAQVMKDQLYGPIENRKYRQYATDIYGAANALLQSTQDLLAIAKMETDYIDLVEKPVDVTAAINKALRFISDKMQAEKLGIKVQLQEPLPRLIADEFRLQQIIMNLLLHALDQTLPEGTITLEARLVTEGRDRMYFALVIHASSAPPYSQAELLELAEGLLRPPAVPDAARLESLMEEQTDVSLELARTLIAMHGATFHIRQSAGETVGMAVFFSSGRIRFSESQG